MIKIGLLSDTHGYLAPDILDFFSDADEIWHAGDIGSLEIVEQLEQVAPVRGVFGNVDVAAVRDRFPEDNIFEVEGSKIYMTHIGGYPGKYEKRVKSLLTQENPALFISGHSHILKVMNDSRYDLLHMNPGAAGKVGLHKHITALFFEIDNGRFENLRVFEMERRKA
jgi:putative phosphoesterase